MSDSSAKTAYDTWKRADAAARAAEARLAEAWEGYFARRSNAPDESLIREVSVLRAVANDRLSSAMATLHISHGDKTIPVERPSAGKDLGPRFM